MAERYQGYVPSNVARDAKYSIKHDLDGVMKVHLIYRSGPRERALLSTDLHPQLVNMVNEVKREVQGAAGGVFYINEFRHVLVKTADRECYYAGSFPDSDPPLSFRYDDTREVSADPDPDLEPGDLWPGPHAGIKYKVTAGGEDISYEHEEQPRRWREYRLSDYGTAGQVRSLMARLVAHKGAHGGRIYVNEERAIFAPVPDEGGELAYIYLGRLEPDDPWFDPPPVPF